MLLAVTPAGSSPPAASELGEPGALEWQLDSADVSYRIRRHEALPAAGPQGTSAEVLRLEAGNGTHVTLRRTGFHVPAIDEFRARIPIKSDRPGIRLSVRVVLPRTRDPQTGQPVTTLVASQTYSRVGRWEHLQVDRLPQQLVNHARALRLEYGPTVDVREAYVDALLLNVYGGSGITNVSIGDPRVSPDVHTGRASEESIVPVVFDGVPRSSGPRIGGAREVRFKGTTLEIAGRTFFPRVIEHRGEPFEYLHGLGFNAIRLQDTATEVQLDSALRLGLLLVCPPPVARPLAGSSADQSRAPQIPVQFDPVLAWELGWDIDHTELAIQKSWATAVRRADRVLKRPIIVQPRAGLRDYSRQNDVIITSRNTLATTLDLVDYGSWVRNRSRLARPGSPIWTTVQTQAPDSVIQQIRGLSSRPVPAGIISSEQIRLVTHLALSAGVRGLVFESASRLDAADPDTRIRALTLELINLQLDLIEPWTSTGRFVTTLQGSHTDAIAAVLSTDRARVLLPVWSGRGFQAVPGQAAANAVHFIVPGVSQASNAYLISPGGMLPLKHKRVTGGRQVTLDELGPTAIVVLTHDPLALHQLQVKLRGVSGRAAQLQREIAGRKLQQTLAIDRELIARGRPAPQTEEWFATARQNLELCDQRLAAGSHREAFLHAERVMRAARLVQRAHWEATQDEKVAPPANPFTSSFVTLPMFWDWLAQLSGSRLDRNLLHGGDCEDLGQMTAAGWHNQQRDQDGVTSRVELSDVAPYSGRRCLRLSARPSDPQAPPALIDSPPVQVTSGPVRMTPGQMFRIHLWVRIPRKITASTDGLLIVDSAGGEDLALRVTSTAGWQEFTACRAAPPSGLVQITLALTGLGEAAIDHVTIEPILTLSTVSAEQVRLPRGGPVRSAPGRQ